VGFRLLNFASWEAGVTGIGTTPDYSSHILEMQCKSIEEYEFASQNNWSRYSLQAVQIDSTYKFLYWYCSTGDDKAQ
jgi:hypothetical protein